MCLFTTLDILTLLVLLNSLRSILSRTLQTFWRRYYRRRSINILLTALVFAHLDKRPYFCWRHRFLALTLLSGSYICAVPIYMPRQKFEFVYWIYVFIFIFLPLYGTLFPTAGFSHRVYPRGFNEAIGTLCFPFFILYGVSLTFGLACMLAATERSKRGSVAISHSFSFVTCRITSYTCIQTFHFPCLSL